jgi:formate C-acetyltransferase
MTANTTASPTVSPGASPVSGSASTATIKTPAKTDAKGVKTPYGLSPRVQWLRDYYYQGTARAWNNEWTAFTTGEPSDELFDEQPFYIVPEVYCFMDTFKRTFNQAAYTVELPQGFWELSLPERRATFNRLVLLDYLPQELLPGDLLAGGRFNIQTSLCLKPEETKARAERLWGRDGKSGIRGEVFAFKDRGFGNCGATSGHLISNYPKILTRGFAGVLADLDEALAALTEDARAGAAGDELRAMRSAATVPGELAARYAQLARKLASSEEMDATRRAELLQMAANLDRVPQQPAETFWEALQALWLTHMLILSDENYPGAGVSFGRLDQYLYPFWQRSIEGGMTSDFGKELLKCFWMHCNYAYDAMIKTGDQGITAGYGQLFNLSGMGPDGRDMTNELTYVMLEVLDEMGPILEPKPNVRLHTNTPEKLLDVVVEMISVSQGAPFLLNFDERSMAGLLREARKAGVERLINEDTVFDYASVGCLENTMCGNDRSATVDCNLNLLKAVELALGGGSDLIAYTDALWDKPYPPESEAPKTGDPRSFTDFEEFFAAFAEQLRYCLRKMVDLYDRSSVTRSLFNPTPYLSCLVEGCVQKARDITAGGAELNFITIEGVTFATTVDSLLAVRYLVFDEHLCLMDELITALQANWVGFERLQAFAKMRAPKYGRDDEVADELARRVMELFAEECWRYQTTIGAQFRPGMLSWNYWIGSGYILPASPDGRTQGQFLSNAICPVNGADTQGPTANANSVGRALGGFAAEGGAADEVGADAVGAGGANRNEAGRDEAGLDTAGLSLPVGVGDYGHWINYLPNGASHTITLSPALMRDEEHKAKLKSFLRGYVQNGGTALQINILDADMLRDAQAHPEDYRNLLVRVTGYNAYFTSVGKELQDEIIARESHNAY